MHPGKMHPMRRFYLYAVALSGLSLFVSCTNVHRDDHSYTYVYQHLTQPQAPAHAERDFPSMPRDRPSLALEADPEPAPAGEPECAYNGVQERAYGAVPVREYAPVQNVVYAPLGPGPFYAPPQSVYYRIPPEQSARPVYSVPSTGPAGLGLFFRSGTHGGSGGNCRRPVNLGGSSIYYSGPPASPPVRGGYGKGR